MCTVSWTSANEDRPLFNSFSWPFLDLEHGVKGKAGRQEVGAENGLIPSARAPWSAGRTGCQVQLPSPALRPRAELKASKRWQRIEVCLAWSIIAGSGRLGQSRGSLCLCSDELCVVSCFWTREIYSHGSLVHVKAGSQVSPPPRHHRSSWHRPSWPPKSLLVDATSRMWLRPLGKEQLPLLLSLYCCSVPCTRLFSSATRDAHLSAANGAKLQPAQNVKLL